MQRKLIENTQMNSKLLTRKQTAGYLGISTVTLWRHYTAGRIAHRRYGGRIFFHEDDIAEFLERSKRPIVED